MTDNTNKTLTRLTLLVTVLLVAVVAQSVMMFRLHRQMQGRQAEDQPDKVALTPDDKPAAGPQTALPPDPFAKDPFDWDLNNWDPFKEMLSMHNHIEQMFGRAYNRFQRSDAFGSLFGNISFSPAINIEEKDDSYCVTVDLPNAEAPNLDVKLDGQTLNITGTVQSETRDEKKGKLLRQERRSGRFQRTITLPGPVQADKMTTRTEKGVLSIEIPKAK